MYRVTLECDGHSTTEIIHVNGVSVKTPTETDILAFKFRYGKRILEEYSSRHKKGMSTCNGLNMKGSAVPQSPAPLEADVQHQKGRQLD